MTPLVLKLRDITELANVFRLDFVVIQKEDWYGIVWRLVSPFISSFLFLHRGHLPNHFVIPGDLGCISATFPHDLLLLSELSQS